MLPWASCLQCTRSLDCHLHSALNLPPSIPGTQHLAQCCLMNKNTNEHVSNVPSSPEQTSVLDNEALLLHVATWSHYDPVSLVVTHSHPLENLYPYQPTSLPFTHLFMYPHLHHIPTLPTTHSPTTVSTHPSILVSIHPTTHPSLDLPTPLPSIYFSVLHLPTHPSHPPTYHVPRPPSTNLLM